SRMGLPSFARRTTPEKFLSAAAVSALVRSRDVSPARAPAPHRESVSMTINLFMVAKIERSYEALMKPGLLGGAPAPSPAAITAGAVESIVYTRKRSTVTSRPIETVAADSSVLLSAIAGRAA